MSLIARFLPRRSESVPLPKGKVSDSEFGITRKKSLSERWKAHPDSYALSTPYPGDEAAQAFLDNKDKENKAYIASLKALSPKNPTKEEYKTDSLVAFGNKVKDIYNESHNRSVADFPNSKEVIAWFHTMKQTDAIASSILPAWRALPEEYKKADEAGCSPMDAYFRA